MDRQATIRVVVGSVNHVSEGSLPALLGHGSQSSVTTSTHVSFDIHATTVSLYHDVTLIGIIDTDPLVFESDFVVVSRRDNDIGNGPSGPLRPGLETGSVGRFRHRIDHPRRGVTHFVEQRRSQSSFIVNDLATEFNNGDSRKLVVAGTISRIGGV